MYNEMYIQGADRFISLAAACKVDRNEQLHRALDDCKLVYSLVANTEWITLMISKKQEELLRI